MVMKILVTGATGFIGRYLVDALAQQGHDIYALVRPTSDRKPLEAKCVKFIEADLSDEKSLGALKAYLIDVIYHCAGLVEDKDLQKLYKTNVAGTDNICRFALEQRVKRVIYLSSVATVSGNEQVPLTEDLPYSATNLYGLSKLEAESLVLEYRRHGLPVVIMRPAMVYGEEEPHAFDRIMRLLQYRLLPMVDGGIHKMHMAYILNVVHALLLALSDDRFLEGSFFVADNEVLTQREVFSVLSQVVTKKDPIALASWMTPILANIPVLGKNFRSFLKDRVYDISRLKALGYKPKYTAKEGLRRSAEYWLKMRV
jgi:nucleoside-diphosphate-sugar epimerase